jgi:iron(III) transport system permease protein
MEVGDLPGRKVLYPVAMLLLGALTNTNPVVDGFGVFDLSLANFVTVLGNPNVHGALANVLSLPHG